MVFSTLKNYVFGVFSLFCVGAIAQPTTYANLFYNNGAEVHVQSGGLIHVQGDFVNKNNAAPKKVTNNGIIEIEGNIDNESGATFERTSGEGVVRLIGGAVVAGVANAAHEQQIKGDWTTNGRFHNLVIDKQTAGTKVKLLTDVEVSGALVWDGSNTANGYAGTASNNVRGSGRSGSGVIQLYDGATDYNLYISNGHENAVKGYQSFVENGSDTAVTDQFILVSGNAPTSVKGFARSVKSVGKDYDFPLATSANSYNSMRFNFSTIPSSGANKITGTFRNGNSGSIGSSCVGCVGSPDNTGFNYFFNNATSSACSGGSLKQWVIFDALPASHGLWSFDGDTANIYTATAYSSSNDLAMGSQNSRLIKYSAAYIAPNDSLNKDWGASIGTSVSSINDLLDYSTNLCYSGSGWRGGVYTGFSHFQLASTTTNNQLPVKLVSLKAEPIQNAFIKVSWITALEIDNKGFEVKRSEDGQSFSSIGWVNGNGTTTEPKNYSYDDKDVVANKTYYYQLNQIDFDGKSEESNIVSARLTDGEQFSVSDFIPNPTNNSTKLVVNTSISQTVKVKFYSLLGQEVLAKEFHLSAGTNDLDFNATELAAATYSAVLVAGNNVYSKKLVVAN